MSVDEWSYRPKETSKPPPGSGFEVFWVLLDACWVLVWCLLGAAPVHSYALLCTMRAGALGVGWSLARTHEPAGGHTGESFQTHTRTHTHAHKRAPFVVVVGVVVVVVLVVVVVAVAVFVVLVVVVVVVFLLVVIVVVVLVVLVVLVVVVVAVAVASLLWLGLGSCAPTDPRMHQNQQALI